MSGISVDWDENFFKRLTANISRELEAGLRQAVSVQQAKVREVITRKKLIDTGNLRNSIQQSVTFRGNKGLGIVGTNVLYALPLELGTKFLKPPRFPAKFFEKGFKESTPMVEALMSRFVKRAVSLSNKGRHV